MTADLDPGEEFPPGDGTADTEAIVHCPYCGEVNEIAVDPGSGTSQSYVEDCQVCCRPWQVFVSYDETGAAHVHLDAADDA
jgi:transposase-like protein